MPVIDSATLSKQIAEKSFSPVYLFTGEDVFRKKALAKQIISKSGADDFNIAREDAQKTDFGELIALANTPPAFSSLRVIEINNIDKLRKDSNALKALVAYMDNPLPSTVLILMHNDAKKIKTDTSLKKAAEKGGSVMDLAPLKGPGLNSWINNALKEKGLKADMQAIDLLMDISGGDLNALTQEIEKLSLLKEDGSVTSEDVLNSIGFSGEENPFALSNAVLDCNKSETLRLIGKLFEEGEEPISMLNKIASCVLKMTRIKRLTNAGLSSQAILSSAGLMFWESRLVASARRFPSEDTLLKTLNRIIDTDMQLKSSSGNNPEVMIKGIVLTLFSK
ncbi:DNA polymerase-3 subunit delta [Elusimicrobium posterum]|uniref:DNA polymerase III subunit delta n=1 Tax=Elusimicrobium posterum TaxID=3116653 RepID=UPI003C777215